jgi:hypothetical protein
VSWFAIGFHVVAHVGVRVTLSQSFSDVLCGDIIPNFVPYLLAIQYTGSGLKCKKRVLVVTMESDYFLTTYSKKAEGELIKIWA